MHRAFSSITSLGILGIFVAGCGGAQPAPAAVDRASEPANEASVEAKPVEPPADEWSASAPAGAEGKLIAHFEEDKAADELKASFGKFLQIAKLSPKTHKSLLKHHLWKAIGTCPSATYVDVVAAPGLVVSKSKPKMNEKAYEQLKAAGVLATQRGVAIEVISGRQTLEEAVESWNEAIIEAALKRIKAAKPGEQKEKNFAPGAKADVGLDRSPKEWSASVCSEGELGGFTVEVQLVAVDAGGKKGKVMVKGGADGDHFTKETFESTYWDKDKGKSYRTLTEIMSVGRFVRQCDSASRFTTSPTQDETWRCKLGTESWDPPNRPIPPWR